MAKYLPSCLLICLCFLPACKPDKNDPVVECDSPPVASFTADITSGSAPLTVTFDNNSLGAASYLWDFGAGTTSTVAEPTHTFSTVGSHTVSLIATSSAGCRDTATVVITVGSAGPVPVASFTIANGGCIGPCQVTFTNTSIDATSFQWDFGDGSPVSSQFSPIHTYQLAGDYLVTLTASGPGGTDTEIKPVLIQALTFKKTFGGVEIDGGASVQQTTDGGYILLGYTRSEGAGGHDVYLIKTDNSGNSIWKKTFGGTEGDGGSSVQQTSDGGYILLGYTKSEGAGLHDLYLVKTDNLGNLIWTKTFGGAKLDVGTSVRQTSDGGYILLGYTESEGAGGHDVYLIKTDNTGNLIWKRTFGGTVADNGFSVRQSSDGGFVLLGSTSSEGAGGQDVYLIKADNSGNLVWKKTFGGSAHDAGRSIQQTTDGGFILLGYTESEGAGLLDVYLIKTDNAGNLIWKKTFGGGGNDEGYSVQQTFDGGYILLGGTESEGAGGYDFYLIKTDDLGNLVWKKAYGGGDFDIGQSLQQTTDGGYILLGETGSFGAGFTDFYLIKTDKDGNAQ